MAKYVVTCLVALLICAVTAAPVEATTAYMEWTGTIDPGQVVNLDAPINVNGWAGQYTFDVTATDCVNLVPLGTLRSYCIDLADEPEDGTYDLRPITMAPLPTTYTNGDNITTAQELKLQKLWSRHAGEIGNDLTKDSLAASFNLAVWEIIYEHTGVLNAKTGSFRSASTTQANKANEWLADLGSWQVGEIVPDLRALVHEDYQDMLHIIPGGGAPYVPEPLTMLGMFLGLGTVGAYIRRRRMK